jgi:hypothetical protein
MENVVKIVVGSLVGAGIGFAISKGVEQQVAPDAPRLVADGSEPDPPRESFRERLARASQAGRDARAARVAELRSAYRARVNDPTAMAERPATDQ